MSTLIPLSTNEDRRSFFKGESWNYIGLEAELPNRGDYRQTFVGETSVIVVRDREDSIHVLINRCSHCGAKVCHNAHGNTKVFVCTYHEWAFNLKEDLRGVPFKRYLDPVILYYFDRVCSGRPLKVLDKMCHLVNSNWKLQVENGKDPFHAALLHSFFKNFGIWRSDQETHVELYQSGAHSLLVSTTSFKAQQEADTTPKVRLKASQLIDHQREFEHGTGAIMTVFPNLIFLQQLNCLAMRHVILDGSDACIKEWIFFGYTDEPEALTELRLHQANLLDPAGLVTIDDNEILAVT
ncbi:Rieske 2Fe-2S domain-containing protein [Candidatus Enterovibrio escicola]|uniref:Ortho-halobenzoate 1,2-dioxygenase alpha-ISP protein OhbB n=1 Tax=Candidatus Enterovibrio escicola TaxID=1927127 RepID=A0A2A5SZI4_9GAMM|nr:Rieske 2Fe-2S domain-containing protein [Candidatus Enterovibrio escacola]PCS21306.1 Ortho-halobenzoate 1,2-dioxygenase alpha-ISP protein OhbB [Candidatus Enterovibrio escacola]